MGFGILGSSSENTTSNTSKENLNNNVNYGGGSPVSVNLSDISTGKKGSVEVSNNIVVNTSDYGAIQGALALVEKTNETQSRTSIQFAEIARQAGAPAAASIENVSRNLLYAALAVGGAFIVWRYT